jgi:hypothetical protein
MHRNDKANDIIIVEKRGMLPRHSMGQNLTLPDPAEKRIIPWGKGSCSGFRTQAKREEANLVLQVGIDFLLM